jgi:bacterial/archaeal transporter family protein
VMSPTLMFLAETVTSALLAIPLFLIFVTRSKDEPVLSFVNAFGVLSGAALAIGLLFYYLALERGQVSIVVPLTATYPIVSVLLGVAILGERPSLSQMFGIVLTIVGIVLLLYAPARIATK